MDRLRIKTEPTGPRAGRNFSGKRFPVIHIYAEDVLFGRGAEQEKQRQAMEKKATEHKATEPGTEAGGGSVPEKDSATGAGANKEKPAHKLEQAEGEVGGRKGPEPTRYGDWENKGIISDF